MKVVTTESGTSYMIDNDSLRVMRIAFDGELRRDGDWLKLLEPVTMKVGKRMSMKLEPLFENAPPEGLTMRMTTPVVSIEEVQ